MSFIDHYLEKYKLPEVPAKQIENLKKLENVIKTTIQDNGADFDQCVKQAAPQITDLTGRLSEQVKQMKPFSWRAAFGMLKFVYNISFEVVQVIETMSSCIVPAKATEAEKEVLLTNAGRDLVWMVWSMVDPLKEKFNWLIFKKTIEKKLVRWLAGLGISSVFHLFKKGLSTSSVQPLEATSVIKAV